MRLLRGGGGAAAGRGRPRSPSSTSHSTTWPPCGAVTLVSSRGAGDRADRARRGRARRRPAASGARWKVPLAGRPASARSGWCRSARPRRACRTNARASSSWSGVLRANVSTPFMARLAMPVRVPAGRHLEDAGDAEVEHRLHAEVPADRAAIWPTIRASTSRPSWTTWPSRLEISGVRGSWVETERARPAEVADGGRHVLGVERAGDATAASAGPWPAGPSAKRLELLDGAGGDDLAGAVVVGGVRPCFSSAASTSSRSPPRTAVMPVGVDGGGLGHRLAALADQHHRLLGGDDAGRRRRRSSSPTLWPATAPILPKASAGCGKSSRAATRPEATSSGWAIGVSRIVSASASVP